MPDAALLEVVATRLAASPPAAEGAAALVLAALDGADAVRATALDGTAAAAATAAAGPRAAAPPAAAFLSSVEVEGFRGIGAPVRFELPPGAGLTVVVGRNGSGKSSLAEALELLLTGSSRRWAERSRVWQEGWRNLHHPTARIEAEFAVEGRRAPVRLRRRWPEGDDLAAARLEIDGRAGTLDALGWERALAAHRPLLSHNELGRILDESPTKLYDALAGILGLDDLTAAQQALRQVRLELEAGIKAAINEAEELRKGLAMLDDERAAEALAAIATPSWDVARVERALATGLTAVEERSLLATLRALATLPVADREAVTAAAQRVRESEHELARSAGTGAGQALRTARLLQEALDVHAAHPATDCPVCGSRDVLGAQWRLETAERVRELRAQGEHAEAAQQRSRAAVQAARRLVSHPPAALADAEHAGVDARAALAQWERWGALADADAAQLGTQLETVAQALIPAVAALRAAAAAELERREDRWRPLARALQAWLPAARATPALRRAQSQLKAAETWLRGAHDALRDERFRPIADSVQRNWTMLRQDSNVELGELRLAGAASARKLTLDVSVDGEPGAALAVMSQGELNCLALSLFLPRATLPESPFRFVVIDDPVQAMDPAKVEGLARVLDDVARERQVVVLTHDDRLPETIRRLDLRATIVEVHRRASSAVSLRPVHDPVQRWFDDAHALARSEGLPEEARRVIPGLCRIALEAACQRSATRRMLQQGRTHADIDEALAQPTKLTTWLALALLGDAGRGADVTAELVRVAPPGAADAMRWANHGSHSASSDDAIRRIRQCEQLAAAIAQR